MQTQLNLEPMPGWASWSTAPQIQAPTNMGIFPMSVSSTGMDQLCTLDTKHHKVILSSVLLVNRLLGLQAKIQIASRFVLSFPWQISTALCLSSKPVSGNPRHFGDEAISLKLLASSAGKVSVRFVSRSRWQAFWQHFSPWWSSFLLSRQSVILVSGLPFLLLLLLLLRLLPPPPSSSTLWALLDGRLRFSQDRSRYINIF